ncbi:hypothetical protein HN014_01160 [Aquimarina sp. TRL1]|uniref:hypothetical protein n=1 Tax=Aquimarina sp. (strain TRL1) TaxID=2736252 RepID=UPI00158DD5A7|nr:hypothetical protein [Aquimarina sp. TRL1]QKX03577.1 hypothetical protein HN014_01160 [Aquimarina sp. TRL1]
MRDRKEILKDIILINGDLSLLEKELSPYSWDVEESLIVLKGIDFVTLFKKSIEDKVTFESLVKWANLIECRDDIDFETDVLQEYIFEIANPEINGELTRERVNEIILDLEMKIERTE